MPNNTVNADKRIVSSKMIGKNAGIVLMFAGLACTIVG